MRLQFATCLVAIIAIVLSSAVMASASSPRPSRPRVPAPVASTPDATVAKRCRRDSHEALFRARSETLTHNDDDAFICDAVLSDAQATCRIASATTHCRLARGGAAPRGDCPSMADCEKCVIAELGRGVRYGEDVPTTGSVARALAGAFGRALWSSKGDGSDGKHGDDADYERIDRAMEFSLYLQEVQAVNEECRHVELRWRAEQTALKLLEIDRRAREVEGESSRRFEQLARETEDVAAGVHAAAENVAALTGRLDAVTDNIDAVNERLVTVQAAADAHEVASRRRFDDVSAAVDAAREGVKDVTAGVNSALATAEELSRHATAARATLDGVQDAVRWLVDSRVTVREHALRFVSFATVVVGVGVRESAVAAAVMVAAVRFAVPFLETEFGFYVPMERMSRHDVTKLTWAVFAVISVFVKWSVSRSGVGDESAWRAKIESRLDAIAADVAALRSAPRPEQVEGTKKALVVATAATKDDVPECVKRRKSTRRRAR